MIQNSYGISYTQTTNKYVDLADYQQYLYEPIYKYDFDEKNKIFGFSMKVFVWPQFVMYLTDFYDHNLQKIGDESDMSSGFEFQMFSKTQD